MKKITCIIAALALTAWGCSSDDDEPSRPTEEIPADSAIAIQAGTDKRPNWQTPDFSRFEQTMSLFLTLQPELVPYSSRQDLLCAIIGGEIRGVAMVSVDCLRHLVPPRPQANRMPVARRNLRERRAP